MAESSTEYVYTVSTFLCILFLFLSAMRQHPASPAREEPAAHATSSFFLASGLVILNKTSFSLFLSLSLLCIIIRLPFLFYHPFLEFLLSHLIGWL